MDKEDTGSRKKYMWSQAPLSAMIGDGGLGADEVLPMVQRKAKIL